VVAPVCHSVFHACRVSGKPALGVALSIYPQIYLDLELAMPFILYSMFKVFFVV